MYTATTSTKKLLKLRKRTKLVPGGTSAGKTIGIMQILIDKSQSDKSPKLTSITSESFPHLRRGAIRDFLSIMQTHNYFKEERWSKTDFTYTFETGSVIEFFSADQPGKVAGPRRDRLYGNEVNNIGKSQWDQMVIRTREEVWADWNPVTDFWAYEEYGIDDSVSPATTTDPDAEVCILTYKDNEALEPSIVNEIERRAEKNNQWGRVYAQGLRGEVEGRIFSNWRMVDDIPHEARLVKRGLDFGYTNDPSGLLDVYEYNGGFIFDEQLYQKGMSNKAIADFINSLPNRQTLVVADSSEPKSIDELRIYGINVIGANKGQGSINQGISFIQSKSISYTKRSINLAKEYRNYMWLKDKQTDQFINKAQDFMNHLLDPARYALESYIPQDEEDDDVTTGDLSSLWG
jgi:phage terminase large subunit